MRRLFCAQYPFRTKDKATEGFYNSVFITNSVYFSHPAATRHHMRSIPATQEFADRWHLTKSEVQPVPKIQVVARRLKITAFQFRCDTLIYTLPGLKSLTPQFGSYLLAP